MSRYLQLLNLFRSRRVLPPMLLVLALALTHTPTLQVALRFEAPSAGSASSSWPMP